MREQRRALIRITRIIVQIHIALTGIALIVIAVTTLHCLWTLLMIQFVVLAVIGWGLVIALNTLKELRWLEEIAED